MERDVPILLVEDDMLDVKNVKRAFREHHVTNPLHIASNGEEALALLRREPPFTDLRNTPLPGLIMLDLNMPVMNGIEFLQVYKKDEELQMIPAVVLTTSDEETDRVETYKVGVAGYIIKPVDFSKFIEAMKRFDLYWTLCAIPN